MTQHMGMMDFSDEEEMDEDSNPVVGYLQVLPPNARMLREIKDGETTVGRNEDQDITVADPSVSGAHAVIEVLEVPGGGGKRLTLKDLRSTNGTYIIDTGTGDKTRLAPKKATMLPEEGCRVQFGGAACKVAMGPLPEPGTLSEEEKNGVYDNDTQIPGVIDLGDDEEGEGKAAAGAGAEEDAAAGSKKSDTEPLPGAEEEGKSEAEAGIPLAGTDASEPGRGAGDDRGRQDQGVEETKGEGCASDGGAKPRSPSRVRFEEEPASTSGGGGGVGGGAGDDDAEQPTQAMALELLDDSSDNGKEREGDDAKAATEQGSGSSAAMALELDNSEGGKGKEGANAEAGEINQGDGDAAVPADPRGATEETAASAAPPGDGGGADAEVAPTDPPAHADSDGDTADEGDAALLFEKLDEDGNGKAKARAGGAAAAAAPAGEENSGDNTADEGDTALLFDDDADGAMAKAVTDSGGGGSDAAGGAGAGLPSAAPRSPGPSAMAGLSGTPMTPSTLPDITGRSVTSPGNVSDVSTQRQESPRAPLRVAEEHRQQQKPGAAEGGRPPPGGDSPGGARETGWVDADIGNDARPAKREESSDDDDDDDGSEVSGALLPAEDDLDDFEDDLLDAGAAEPAETGGNGGGGSGGGAGAEAATAADGDGDSGSETDATEVDTDEGPLAAGQTENIRDPPAVEENASAGGGTGSSSYMGAPQEPAEGTTVSSGRASPGASSGSDANAGGVDASEEEHQGRPGQQPPAQEDARSPGGSLLRRVSTEDSMMAIAREHARSEARAAAMNQESEPEEEEEHDQGETEVDNGTGEAATQAIPVQLEEDEEEEEEVKEEEEAGDGTEVVEEGDSPPQQDDFLTPDTSALSPSKAQADGNEVRGARAGAAGEGVPAVEAALPEEEEEEVGVEPPMEAGDAGEEVVEEPMGGEEEGDQAGNDGHGEDQQREHEGPRGSKEEERSRDNVGAEEEGEGGEEDEGGGDGKEDGREGEGEGEKEGEGEEETGGKEAEQDAEEEKGTPGSASATAAPALTRTSGRREQARKGDSTVDAPEGSTSKGLEEQAVNNTAPRAVGRRAGTRRAAASASHPEDLPEEQQEPAPPAPAGRRGRGGKKSSSGIAPEPAAVAAPEQQANEDSSNRRAKRRRTREEEEKVPLSGTEETTRRRGKGGTAASAPAPPAAKRGRRSSRAAAAASASLGGDEGDDAEPQEELASAVAAGKKTRGRWRAAKESEPSHEDTAATPKATTATARGGSQARGKGKGKAVAVAGVGKKRNAGEAAELDAEESDGTGAQSRQRGGKGKNNAAGARKRKTEEAGVPSYPQADGTDEDNVASAPAAASVTTTAGGGRGRKSSAAKKGTDSMPAAVAPATPSKRGRCRPAEAAAAAAAAAAEEKEREKTTPRSPAKTSGRGRGAKSSPPTPTVASRSASGGGGVDSQSSVDVKVCFTGVKPTPKERSCMKKLGVSEVESVLEATHLVAGGSGVSLKRTPKLLAGLGRCRFVVDVEWLYQSAKDGKLLDGVEYVLSDAEAEKKWGFNMRVSLGRRPEAGLLSGLFVHVDPCVAGVKGMGCPPLEEMEMVVISAGGQWLPQLPKRGGPEPESLLVISHPDTLKAAGAKGAKSRAAAAAGRNGKAYLPEMLFLCILRQKMSWPADLVAGGGSAEAGPASKKPAKRRRV